MNQTLFLSIGPEDTAESKVTSHHGVGMKALSCEVVDVRLNCGHRTGQQQ